MKDLMKKEDREIKDEGASVDPDKIREFKEKIKDKNYLDHAINRIATDLSHYLTR
ncbi:MAG: hypothetical protein MUD12_01615 [Spirochaetes bacterium]|jgi:hypothetical protein|nr:hypothetical protein [Spirochaetota bacterium]